MKLSFLTVDVFTTTPYSGNPLAIVLVPAVSRFSLTQTQKLQIAKEFNLSETVFLHLPENGTSPTDREIDIFTTNAELPFAGHPTIGVSTYLLTFLKEDVEAVITKAGRIPLEFEGASGNVKAEVPHNFHIHKQTFKTALTDKENVLTSFVKGMSFIFVELLDLPTLAKVSKGVVDDCRDVSPLDEDWRQGMIGTMYYVPQGTDNLGRRKYRTRMISWTEDSGTGSASCGLACYIATTVIDASEGQGPFGFIFEQGVEMGRRNEIIIVVTRGDDGMGIKKVELSGAAVKVMEGSLEI